MKSSSSTGSEPLKAGDQVLVAGVFNDGDRVDVIGISRGKGFQGVMKRHNFAGGAATHGSMFHRAPGSIGASSFPSRVVKGMRAAGRMGGDHVTVRNLKIVTVDGENNVLIIRGAVPGAPGTYLIVRKAIDREEGSRGQVEKAGKMTVAKKRRASPAPLSQRRARSSALMKIDIVNANKEIGRALELKDEIFGGRVNTGLIWESVTQENAAERRGTHQTKNRSAVSGSGKKPWRQKGTGRARVGEIRNPLWRKGGTVFGPMPRSYEYALPRKVKLGALRAALAAKLADGTLLVVDSLKAPTATRRPRPPPRCSRSSA